MVHQHKQGRIVSAITDLW